MGVVVAESAGFWAEVNFAGPSRNHTTLLMRKFVRSDREDHLSPRSEVRPASIILGTFGLVSIGGVRWTEDIFRDTTCGHPRSRPMNPPRTTVD